MVHIRHGFLKVFGHDIIFKIRKMKPGMCWRDLCFGVQLITLKKNLKMPCNCPLQLPKLQSNRWSRRNVIASHLGDLESIQPTRKRRKPCWRQSCSRSLSLGHGKLCFCCLGGVKAVLIIPLGVCCLRSGRRVLNDLGVV